VRRRRPSPRGFWSDHAGGAAVEFAMVLPAFITVVIGGFYVCMIALTLSSMHFAVEAAARCASVNATSCPDNTTTASYAAAHYAGVGLTPTFTASNPSCGYQVAGSVTFALDMGLSSISVPLSTTACFP